MANVSKIVKFMRGIRGNSPEEVLLDIARQTVPAPLRMKQRISVGNVFDEVKLEDLPACFQKLKHTLKNPTIEINGNFGAGTSVWSSKVKDSGQVIDEMVLSIDRTKGTEPIIQTRRSTFMGDEKIYSASELYDTNQVVTESSKIVESMERTGSKIKSKTTIGNIAYSEGSIDIELAQKFSETTKISLPTEQEITRVLSREDYNQILKYLRAETKKELSVLQKYARQISRMDKETVLEQSEKFLNYTNKSETELTALYQKITGKTGKLSSQERFEMLDSMASSEFFQEINGKIPDAQFKEIYKKFNEYTEIKDISKQLNSRKMTLGLYGKNFNDEYIETMIKKLKISPRKIQDKEMLRKLSELKSLPFEQIIVKAKEIISKSFGIPSKLITVEKQACEEFNDNFMAMFMPLEFKLLYNEKELLKLTPEEIISTVYHEMMHARDFVKSAKRLGLENFTRAVCGNDRKKYGLLNVDAYQKAMKCVNADNINPNKYLSAMYGYVQAGDSLYSKVKYYSNLFERNAYKEEVNMVTALCGKIPNSQSAHQIIVCQLSTQIQAKLTKIAKLKGKDFNEQEYFELAKRRSEAVIDNDFKQSVNVDLLEEMIKILDSDIQKLKQARKTT